ncbi:MAG: D-alanine--D-alanine ligase [Ancrocorticia sp.]|jgi:D-alanine-D-alanine ligase|nr:D-alanine--D-alanine ligase [Ancrocorticia sp.]MCI2179287.1 D-alanine--D-alanine ligase [Ancrocorticia sp.]MCI2193842.1 D-alanine--D-alanine ligase [Ancrocorticia sp.]MCI2199560.1 D-alanine--D-alanine ligase [Ancrocorticia sp.]
MTNPLTVAILAGGLTHEREVSLHSGRRMTALLREAGMQVKMLDVDGGLLGTLKAMSPDIVWPLVHGSTGEDGSLQDLLSLIGIPFIGSRAGACRIASDKAVASAVLATSGIAVPAAITLPQALFREVGVGPILDLVEKRFGFPLVVKPAQGGSALGLTIVEHAGALPGAMVDCYAYGDEARIEVYYAGTEVAVSVIDVGNGPEALPPVEIVTDGPYDYDARYNAGRAEYFTPARLDGELLAFVKETALRVYELLGLRHLSRIDIIVQSDGTVRVLDINVAPGMTETSLFPQAVQAEATAQGIDASDYYVKLVESASTN